MNLQESIRKILREEYNERQMKLLTLASKVGFLKTAEMVGGVGDLLSILGDNFLSTNNKIKIIKEIAVEKTLGDYMSLTDLGLGGVEISNTGEKYRIIDFLNSKDVMVSNYGGDYYKDFLGNERYYYEELPKDIIDVLFRKLLNYYIDSLEK